MKIRKKLKTLFKKVKDWLKGLFGRKDEAIRPQWCYGGISGAGMVEDTSAAGYRIDSVSFNGATVAFSGAGGMWGATHANPSARCCMFFKEGNEWYGGFYEYVSPDRLTRSVANIDGRYKGWDPARFHAATEYAYCICDYKGTKRSNIAVCTRRCIDSIEEPTGGEA